MRRKRKHKSPKKLSKKHLEKMVFLPGKNPTLWNLSFIFANFDNFAPFVDRAVFTFIKDWNVGFPNMVLSTEYSEAVNARYTFQPLRVSGNTD